MVIRWNLESIGSSFLFLFFSSCAKDKVAVAVVPAPLLV